LKYSKTNNPYFEVIISNDKDIENEYRLVVFDCDAYKKFKSLSNGNEGCICTHVEKTEKGDYIFNDSSQINQCKPKFERQELRHKIFTLKEVINETTVYDKVAIKAKVISEDEEGKTADACPFKTIVVTDISNEQRTLTVYADMVNRVSLGNSYIFTRLLVAKYSGHKVLRSTPFSSINELETEVMSSAQAYTSPFNEKVTGKITSINLQSVTHKVLKLFKRSSYRRRNHHL